MSFDLQKAVWKYGPDDPTQHHVLLALADYANDDGGGVYPAIDTIAAKCRLSRSTAIRALKALAAGGWIERQRHGQSSNSYLIIVQKLIPQSVNMTLYDETQSVTVTPSKCQNDTLQSVKMTPDPIILTNQLTNNDRAPLETLRGHFAARTAVQPNDRTGAYERDWVKPLEGILLAANGDVAAAVALIDAALEVARGKNDRGKVYPVASPRSIAVIAANLAAAGKVSAMNGDADTIWQQVRAALNNGFNTAPPPLQTAMRVVGWPRIKEARERDVPQLKQEVFNAYRSAATV